MLHTYPIETAESLFAMLQSAFADTPHNLKRIYYTFSQVFRLTLDQQTAAVRTNFVGPYAKLDYLLKEHNAPEALRRQINSTRIRLHDLNRHSSISLTKVSDSDFHTDRHSASNHSSSSESADAIRQQFYLTDLANIVRFIALIFKAEIPSDIAALFPADLAEQKGESPYKPEKRRIIADYLRAIVSSWDETFIRCRIDGYASSSEVRVRYAFPESAAPSTSLQGKASPLVYPEQSRRGMPSASEVPGEVCSPASSAPTSQAHHNDFSYLGKMLKENSQLNLVRPREEEGYLTAEFIILEPDYLVDISTVARCFESYAESPYVNLVKKLQPSANGEAVVLGNFAGQLLDEELHDLPANHTYADSVGDFFRSNAIKLLTADLGKDFHDKAKQQKQNIEAAIRSQLPSLVTRFDSHECIVEPSFFCEMLGLQGRMDMLQMDFRVLLEQKSGKGGYPQGDFSRPRHTEQHYVQLLLYMAVLRYGFRHVYEANNRELHAFLLYSRYTESLLGLSFAPSLLLRALQIRNGIACTELQFAEPGQLRILERITPDSLNQKKTKGPLWERYVRPQLDALLSPIRNASPLERDYYFRFLSFIAGEHLLAKFGNKTKENSGFASIWHNTLDEKLQGGNIYHDLLFLPSSLPEAGTVDSVQFQFGLTPAGESSNFRIGDIVVLYPYPRGSEPDVRRAMVFRGSIADITLTDITIQLRAPQTSARVFEHWKESAWAIEHDFIESTYSALYRSMHSLLSAPQERRDLLLLQRHPRVTQGRPLVGHYGSFDELSGRVKDADELFLIIGPPGTGKTSFGMLNTLLETLTDPDASVLILSFTNRAVDEICSKLVESEVPFVRLGRSFNTPEAYRPYLLDNQMNECSNIAALRRLIDQARVVVSTTSTLHSNLDLLTLKTFSLAIIDEASQILEPDLVGIFSAQQGGVASIRKFVLIGDHKQLPAVVQQTAEAASVDEPSLHAIGLHNCRNSLFERFLSRYANDPSVTYMLTRQGRMHPAIADFVNHAYYNGRLDVVPLPHQIVTSASTHDLDSPNPPASSATSNSLCPNPLAAETDEPLTMDLSSTRVLFLDAPLPNVDLESESANLKVNTTEAALIAKVVYRIYSQAPHDFHPLATVGIIVPYRNQITAVRQALGQYDVAAFAQITIDTVERYQGSQRDYIIYGFTVQRRFQLNFLTDNVFIDTDGTMVDRKLNVALTRAKLGMVLIGHVPLLREAPTLQALIEYCEAKQCLRRCR